MTDLVSVILPVYNGEKYLEETLRSVQNQTYENLEILIVDDGSTDKTSQIVESFQKEDNRIKYIFQRNQGPAEAKNRGIQLFTGKYAIFLDSDDLLEKKAISEMVSVALKNSADLVVFSFNRFNDNFEGMGRRNASSSKIDKMFTAVWNKMYHSSILKKLSFPKNTIYEDVAFSAMAVLSSKKIAIIPASNPLYNYRQQLNSLTKSSHDVEQQLDIIVDFEEMFEFIKENNITVNQQRLNEIERLINTQVFSHSLLAIQSQDDRQKIVNVIKQLTIFQRNSVKNIFNYNENILLNTKQIILMFLLKKGLFKATLTLAKVANSVRSRKELRG
ncbi:glycosyltransferase family 2 protein [Leuconostoc lactis]|uniref:glycosyltransferase family 2 protein n=1 Tax=Leuconostoc lactis TaxID=1246 RepID=UPI001C201509|nr:glycosyltransferase family 2 protein [Leuconostoc lactis]MBU7538082.1 glycosyltransferase family 2 protein [Leuconostoc lactis]